MEFNGLICEKCGSKSFEYYDFWKECACSQCGWIKKPSVELLKMLEAQHQAELAEELLREGTSEERAPSTESISSDTEEILNFEMLNRFIFPAFVKKDLPFLKMFFYRDYSYVPVFTDRRILLLQASTEQVLKNWSVLQETKKFFVGAESFLKKIGITTESGIVDTPSISYIRSLFPGSIEFPAENIGGIEYEYSGSYIFFTIDLSNGEKHKFALDDEETSTRFDIGKCLDSYIKSCA